MLRHAYALRRVSVAHPSGTGGFATLSAGTGTPPDARAADLVFRVTGTLHKHFGGRDETKPWLSDAAEFNPLGFDWIAVNWRRKSPVHGAQLSANASLVAAPDRS